MSSIEMIRTMYEYDVATWRRVWDSIATLTPEQYVQEMPYSHGSVRNLMVHVTRVTLAWTMGLKNEPGGQEFKLENEDFPTVELTRARWEEAAQALLEHIDTLTDADLDVTLPEMMGPTWHVLVHLVNHDTDHRATVLSDLHLLGAPTFAQDMIFYLWFKPR